MYIYICMYVSMYVSMYVCIDPFTDSNNPDFVFVPYSQAI